MAGTNLGTAYVTIMPSAKGISGSMSKIMDGEATSAGTSAGNLFTTALKGVLLVSGVAVVKKFFSAALEEGGKLQQSFGGLDTIYGDAAEGMKDMAYQAAQAGISANDYAEQAVSLGAALKQAFKYDTKDATEAQYLAAQQANKVIMDMQDNAAKMGTDIGRIQDAYQGFAKQNYTMLDNLKLGYGGTKTEMERLLEDATKLSGIEYNIENLADVTDAIHVIQEDLGIVGVAASEAEGTYTGSMAAMKASTSNLLANLALGKDIVEPLKSLAGNTKAFLLNNLFPMIGNVIKQMPKLIGTGLKTLFSNLPGAVEGLKNFFNDLPEKLKDGSGKVIEWFKDVFSSIWDSIKSTDWAGLAQSIWGALKAGITTAAPILQEGFKNIATNAKEWFQSVNWHEVGQNAIRLIGDGIGTVGSFLWERIKDIASSAVEWWDSVDWSNAGKNAFHKVVEGLKAVGSTIWEAIKGIAERAASHFSGEDGVDWKGVGKKILTMIGEGAMAVGQFLWEAIKSIGTTAKEWFQSVDWKQLGINVITDTWNGIVSIGNWIWEKLKEIGQTAWDWFKSVDWKQLGHDAIATIHEGLSAVQHWIWEKTQFIAQLAAEKFKSVDWKQLGHDTVKYYHAGMSEIQHWIWEKAKFIADLAKEKFNSVDWKQLGKDVIDFIWDGLSEIGSKIWDKLKEIGESARDKFLEIDWKKLGEDIIDAIWNGVKAAGGWIVDGLGWLADKAGLSFLSKDWQGVGDDASEELGRGVEDGGWHTTSAMDNIAYNASTAFDMYDWFSIGGNMTLGINDGIAFYAQYCYNSISNLAYNVYNTVHSIFRIGSPSKLMRDKIGKWIPLGIAAGIDDEAHSVTDAMTQLCTDAIDSAETGLADMSYNATLDATNNAAAERGGITVNVYGTQGMDVRELADEVIDRITFLMRQEEAAWGTA